MLNALLSRTPPPPGVVRAIAISGAAAALATAHLGAQSAAPSPLARSAAPVTSMGQPPRWQPYGAALAGVARGSDGAVASLLAGVHRSLLNPVTGLAGASAEVYANAGAGGSAGLRLLGVSRIFGLSAGADWRPRDSRVDALLSFQSAIRRGGLVGHGSMVRVDYLPTRSRTLTAGITVPLFQPWAGRTRPRSSTVSLPDDRPSAATTALPAAAESALGELARDAALLRAYTSVGSTDDEVAIVAAADRGGFAATARRYDDALAAAFRAAAGAAAPPAVVDATVRRARAAVLGSVIIAYDSLFGRPKARDDIRGLAGDAERSFARWLADSSGIAAPAHPAVAATFARWLDIVIDVHRALRARWTDSRLVWLPLQLALAPDEYDEQREVDSLIARVAGRQFTDENALSYLRSSDLPLEIARSIYATRAYHVLWLHDFAGQRPSGDVDDVGYRMVADAYFPALTAAVKRYDSTGVFPVYLVLLDQYFYEPTDGRLWMTILEDPLRPPASLPDHDQAHLAHLRERVAELRAAVAASARLQREAAAEGGERWLRRIVKVHVNVTEPSDFSFRSSHILPPLPFAPDNLMRDHRKIVFYDLDEADPYRGGMLLMGVGIGEHYASPTWEDRGYRLRGPAALEARAAVRRVLHNNGFADDDIPGVLRVVAGAPADTITERRADRGDYVGRAVQLHNETGFGAKRSSIARAVLYTLTPPGSLVIVPDPLWLSATWAAMLSGAAARGSRVLIVAPARENAPSPEAPLMATAHDLMSSLLHTRTALRPALQRTGGALEIGIFAARAPVTDVAGRLREIRAGLARYPWIREVIPFDDATLASLDRVTTQTNANAQEASPKAIDERPRPPQLHQKTQFFARPGAIGALLRQPGWDDALAAAMRLQSAQTVRFGDQLGEERPNTELAAVRSADARLRAYEQSLTDAERKQISFYFSLGTQNEDPRGLMSDGEASVLVSGAQASAGLVDLYFILARSEWVTTDAELERHLPKPSRLWRLVARALRATL